MEAFVKYTVKQLANYSGVSARTLRFYDKIGLLSPAYYAENGYRYYGKKELLNLQQILFFRELGFKLSDIKTIITQNEFDRVKSLQKHKIYLLEKIQEFKTLIKTVDKTLLHLHGEINMKETELYLGFKHPEQMSMIHYLQQQMGASAENIINQCKENIVKLDPSDIKVMQQQTQAWCHQFKLMIEKKHKPNSKATQTLMNEYYQQRILPFCNPNFDEFMALIQASISHPGYKAQYHNVYSQFSEFFLAAAKHYANKNLQEKKIS